MCDAPPNEREYTAISAASWKRNSRLSVSRPSRKRSTAAQTLPCLRVVGWDVAILPGGKLELIEGNHNPGMNIVQAPAKHGVHDKFAHMLLDFYGDPAQYAYETVKQP